MKKVTILTLAGLVLLLTGCVGSGAAKTTLDPMKNIGPIVFYEETTVVTNGTTNVTTIKRMESPEKAQKDLRLKELEERGSTSNPPGAHYWWQTQHSHPYGSSTYWGGTR